MFFSEVMASFSVCFRLLSRYPHTDCVHNSGVVWGRVSRVHPALLQQVEVTVSVATEWNNNQLPLATARKRTQHRVSTARGGVAFRGRLTVYCVTVPQSTGR